MKSINRENFQSFLMPRYSFYLIN